MSAVAESAKAATIRSVPTNNPQMVNRLVGYLEYGRALALLDRLMESVSPAELEAIDEMIEQRDEYAVYTNLSRRLEPKPDSLSERIEGSQSTEQRGLAWIMGLARVELGAMAVGFTDQPDPFNLNRPGRYELPAYSEVLADSMRTHYWALQTDPVAQNVKREIHTDTQGIAYARRVTLAIELVRATRMIKAGEYTESQYAELDQWERELVGLQEEILYDVLRLDDPVSAAAKRSMFQQSCGRLFAQPFGGGAMGPKSPSRISTSRAGPDPNPPKLAPGPKPNSGPSQPAKK